MTRVIYMAEERARRALSTAAETALQRTIRDQVLSDLLDDSSQTGGSLDMHTQQFQTLENILDGLPPFGDAA